MKFADPTNHIAFKKIFGDSNKKEILISFLNAVLGFENNKAIKDVAINTSYQTPNIREFKEIILDIKAINQDNEHFMVKIQKKDLNRYAKNLFITPQKPMSHSSTKVAITRHLKKSILSVSLTSTCFPVKITLADTSF